MTIDDLVIGLLYVCIPWAVVEAASLLLQRYAHRAGSAVLGRARLRLTRAANTSDAGRTTWMSRGPLWMKVETVALNALPGHLLHCLDRLSARVSKQKDDEDSVHEERQVRRALDLFYDAGIVFAGLALFGSIAFLVWGAFDLVGQIAQLAGGAGRHGLAMNGLARRGLEEASSGPGLRKTSWSPNLVPMIPGLTLPLSHIVPLTMALSFTQVIHEAGHAICGTMHDWIPLRTGLVLLFPCIPGAFVVLPQHAMQDEDDDSDSEDGVEHGSIMRKRLRTIAAGVWHNAVTAGLLALVLYSGLAGVMHDTLWKDANGMKVEWVDPASPLSQHMPVATLVTRLDDVDLTGTVDARQAVWDAFLLQDSGRNDSLGWCVLTSSWQTRSTLCCDALGGANSTTQDDAQESLCFASLEASLPPTGRCLNPVHLVSGKTELERCTKECPDDTKGQSRTCVVADEREQLVRITVVQADQASSRVVLFQGSRTSIYAALAVSPVTVRLESLPLPYHIFQWWSLLLAYTLNLSLAMALLNMLPLPSLDGDVYLQISLAAFVARFHPDDVANDYIDGADNGHKDEESVGGIGMETRVTSRPMSPTQLRRPSTLPARLNVAGQRTAPRRSTHRLLNARLLAKTQSRLKWIVTFLAVFVFGGSILLHAVKASE